jgi:hypothetical protein
MASRRDQVDARDSHSNPLPKRMLLDFGYFVASPYIAEGEIRPATVNHLRFPNGQISNRYHQCLSNELRVTVILDT